MAVNASIEPIHFSPAGASIQLTTSAGEAAIPTLSNGDKPKYVLVNYAGSSNPAYIRFGQTGETVAGDGAHFYATQGMSLIVNVSGCTHFMWSTAGGTDSVVVTPLANGGGLG